MKGREKVDLHCEVNLGVFGLVRPDNLAGLATGDKATEAVGLVLKEFTFPSLNIVFAASARLRERDHNDLKVETQLDEMELRVVLTPLDVAGKPIADGAKCSLLGVDPYGTTAAKVEPPFQVAPNVSSILTAIPSIPSALTGIVSGLGLSFGSVMKPSFPITSKAFLAGPREFGWYLKSNETEQKEGVHYGTAFLQLSRSVAKLQVQLTLGSDWKGGSVDNQSEPTLTTILEVKHPAPPETPQITDFTSPDSLPLVIPRDDVKKLLAIDDAEFAVLVSQKRLDAFGSGDAQVVTKGSLLALLRIEQAH
jgi:hypothetical protein